MTLERSSPLKRGKPLKRTDFKVTNRKTLRASRGESCPPAVEALLVERSLGLCEANTPVCTGQPSVAHHRIRRPLPPSQLWFLPILLWLCPACHDWVHHNVEVSEALGHLVRRYSPEGRELLAAASTGEAPDA